MKKSIFLSIMLLSMMSLSALDLVIEYKCGNPQFITNQLHPHFVIRNQGSETVELNHLAIRYYYTKEAGDSQRLVYSPDNYNSMMTADWTTGYIELGFRIDAGNLAPYSSSREIGVIISKWDHSSYDQSDDYSFNYQSGSYTVNEKIVLYHQGSIVWGVPDPAFPTPAPTCQPCSFTVTGHVEDPDSNPVEGAAVSLKNSNVTTSTNFAGEFILEKAVSSGPGCPSGDYLTAEINGIVVERMISLSCGSGWTYFVIDPTGAGRTPVPPAYPSQPPPDTTPPDYTAPPVISPAPTNPPAVVAGDVDDNGIINIVDALLVAQYCVNLTVSINLENGDVNLDGSVNIVDALIIAQYYVGLVPRLPVGPASISEEFTLSLTVHHDMESSVGIKIIEDDVYVKLYPLEKVVSCLSMSCARNNSCIS